MIAAVVREGELSYIADSSLIIEELLLLCVPVGALVPTLFNTLYPVLLL